MIQLKDTLLHIVHVKISVYMFEPEKTFFKNWYTGTDFKMVSVTSIVVPKFATLQSKLIKPCLFSQVIIWVIIVFKEYNLSLNTNCIEEICLFRICSYSE